MSPFMIRAAIRAADHVAAVTLDVVGRGWEIATFLIRGGK